MHAAVVAAAARAVAVVPVVLIVLFIGVLWLLGLLCGQKRREYVMKLSGQAMGAVGLRLHGPVMVSGSQAPASTGSVRRGV
jgi:hypothetical protein